jgi:hypothetical protein
MGLAPGEFEEDSVQFMQLNLSPKGEAFVSVTRP